MSARALKARLRGTGRRLVAAESCTGGMFSAALTAVPGASEWFSGGVVTYSNELKTRLLGVSEALLSRHGAVSAECAEAMARGALARLGGDVAVAITGIAGPDGGTRAKPVGLVHFGLAWRGDAGVGASGARRRFTGGRAAVRRAAVRFALEWTARMLRLSLGDARRAAR